MKNKNIVLGFMLGIAICLQIFESFIPMPFPIPGGKLGLANIVTIVVLFLFGAKEAIVICLLRSILGSVLHGGVVSMIYSVSGAFLSTVIAIFLKKHSKFTIIGLGIMSALANNFAQVTVAISLMENLYIFTYYPVLMLVSIPSGAITGYVSGLILNKLKWKGRLLWEILQKISVLT